jgi:hypothetical protein
LATEGTLRPLSGSVSGEQIDAQREVDPQREACSKEQRDVFKQVVAIFLVQQRLPVGHNQQAQGNDWQADDVQRADTNGSPKVFTSMPLGRRISAPTIRMARLMTIPTNTANSK